MAELREIVIADPFAVLGVPAEAGDEAIKRRYLALVRAFPPDREPERFQAYRRAYEAIRDARLRTQLRLLHATDGALTRLKLHYLQAPAPAAGGVRDAAVTALITDGLRHLAWD
jgi:curved DNA-binding protein CbpA